MSGNQFALDLSVVTIIGLAVVFLEGVVHNRRKIVHRDRGGFRARRRGAPVHPVRAGAPHTEEPGR